jgi:hypothetical protein
VLIVTSVWPQFIPILCPIKVPLIVTSVWPRFIHILSRIKFCNFLILVRKCQAN